MSYNNSSSTYARSLNATDISAQFEGFEIEFDEKVTLFPVQLEKATPSSRRAQEFGVTKVRRVAGTESGQKRGARSGLPLK